MEIAHSYIGASTCSRWWNCPGSINLIKTVPPPPTSEYAAEGTAAHEVAQRCLESWLDESMSNLEPQQMIDEVMENGIKVTEEMAKHVMGYLNMIYHDIKPMLSDKVGYKDLMQVEHKFNLKWIHKDMFGTNDCNIAQHFGKLIVYDLKYGAGVAVEVKDNKQLMYYGLGAMQQGDFTEIELVIYQPRAPHKDGPIRRWTLTPNELMNFGMKLKDKAMRTFAQDAKRKAGDWCKFCPAINVCPEARDKVMEVAKVDFSKSEPSLKDPRDLDMKTLVRILEFTPFIDDWLRNVTAHAQALAEAGQHIPGYKLVKKRSNRRWINPDEAKEQLEMLYGEDIYNQAFKSPAQMEKVATKEEVARLCEKSETGNTLVPEADGREASKPSAIEDFS